MTERNINLAHLTEDEIDEVLMGTESTGPGLHLESCADCRARVGEFESSMAMFNQASGAWSEAKSNALNRDLSGHKTPFRLGVGAVWACASVLLLILAGVGGAGLHSHFSEMTASKAHFKSVGGASAAVDPASEIASDNALMTDIDKAINSKVSSPEELYGDLGGPAASGTNAHSRQVKN